MLQIASRAIGLTIELGAGSNRNPPLFLRQTRIGALGSEVLTSPSSFEPMEDLVGMILSPGPGCIIPTCHTFHTSRSQMMNHTPPPPPFACSSMAYKRNRLGLQANGTMAIKLARYRESWPASSTLTSADFSRIFKISSLSRMNPILASSTLRSASNPPLLRFRNSTICSPNFVSHLVGLVSRFYLEACGYIYYHTTCQAILNSQSKLTVNSHLVGALVED